MLALSFLDLLCCTYTSLGVTTKRTNNWTELNIDTLCTMFLAHLVPSTVELATIPRCSDCAAGRERRDVVSKTNTQRAVLHAESIEIQSRDGTNSADTGLTLPSCASGEVDLLEEGQLANKCACLFIGSSPVTRAFYPTGQSQ